MHRWTAITFVTIRISIFEWDTAVSQNKIFLIKNQKLLHQHSEITVLISLMTSHRSTSLFLATGLRPCLVSLRVLSITSRWRHERMRSSNKLSADTVLRILARRARDPSGLRQESRALGATISGMRNRWRLYETGWAEFGYFLCYFKMVAPRALVFRPLVKGNEDSGNGIESYAQQKHAVRSSKCLPLLSYNRHRPLLNQRCGKTLDLKYFTMPKG